MSEINPAGRPHVNGVQNNQRARPQQAQDNQPANQARGQDQVQLSDHARMLSKLRENPIREAKVDQVRQELAQGTYETQGKLNQALEELSQDLG
jgi:negative regulator of flagellin synthesis FlgM